MNLRRVYLTALFAVAGCATAKPAPEQHAVQTQARPQQKKTETAAGETGPNAHALRAFEDANKVFAATQAAAKPDWSEPERKYKQVIGLDDSFAEAYFNLGVVYERERKLDDAEDAYKTALAKKPSLHQAAENLAVMQENAGHQDKAIATYQDMVQRFPQDGGARARMAALFAEQGQQEQALKLAKEALERDPKNVTAYKVMMRVYLEQKNLSLAELVALRATKLDATDPELYYTIGQIALQQKDELRAIEQFQHALKERDDYLVARIALANLALKHHDWNGAAQQYEKLVQYQPKSSAAHLDLGIAYRGLGQADKAFQQYEEAKKLDENNAEVYYAIGVVLDKNKGQPEKALEYYKQYLQKAGSVAGDHPVYEAIKVCEQVIQANQQAEQQMKMMKEQEEQQKKQKELEEKNKASAGKGAPAAGAPTPNGQPTANGAAPAGGAVKPNTAALGGVAPKPAEKPPEKPAVTPAAATPAPAPAPAPTGAPSDADEPPDSVK